MPFATFALRPGSEQNAREPWPGPLAVAVYQATATPAQAYPLGGEPVDFSAQFRQIFAVIVSAPFNPPGPGIADAVGAWQAVFEDIPGSENAGLIRFYRSGGAGANFPELPVGAYPNGFRITITVYGVPATNAGF